MNIRPALLCTALAALTVPACPTALAQLLPADVAGVLALAEAAAAKRAPPKARVQAQVGTLDPRLKLAPCSRTEAHLAPGAPAWGRTRVGLRCTQGSVLWNISVPVLVQVLAPALATTTALPAGVQLTAADLTSTEVNWAEAPTPPFTDSTALLGRVLARAVPAGQALRINDLRPRQWFASGQTVRVLAAGPGFAIAAEGQALANGMEGQPVRVRTEQGRVLTGLPTGERQVEVGL